MENLIKIITKPDNVAIVVMMFMVAFFTWLAFREALRNDRERKKSTAGSDEESQTRPDKINTWPFLAKKEFIITILVFALLFGRVFCSGVCPFGGIQDLVLLKPVRVPRRLDKSLGLLKYVYLAVALWFATRPADTRDYIICRFDPFVGLFRFSGPGYMLIIGGVLLALSIFVGRAYCRYLCPYGALLAILSRFSWKRVTITPDNELDCGLCTDACPFGAIEKMRAARSSCLHCVLCYATCPREPANRDLRRDEEDRPSAQRWSE